MTVSRTVAFIAWAPPSHPPPSMKSASAVTSHVPAGRRTSGANRNAAQECRFGSVSETPPDLPSSTLIGVTGPSAWVAQSGGPHEIHPARPADLGYAKLRTVPDP